MPTYVELEECLDLLNKLSSKWGEWRALRWWRTNRRATLWFISSGGRVAKCRSRGRPLLLNGSLNSGGYRQIRFTRGGEVWQPLIHRLVYQVFKTPDVALEEGVEVDHKDQDKLNNDVRNLRAADRSLNSKNRRPHSNPRDIETRIERACYQLLHGCTEDEASADAKVSKATIRKAKDGGFNHIENCRKVAERKASGEWTKRRGGNPRKR